MFRYKFTDKKIFDAIKYIKEKKGTRPSFMSKFETTVRGGKLFVDSKEVIRTSAVNDFVRKKVLSGSVPLSRDALFYFLQQRFVNIPRAAIDKLLKAQSVIRETDKRQPKTTAKKSRQIHKRGILEYDLVEIYLDQLTGLTEPDDVKVKKGFFFGMVDRLTGLSFYEFATHKSYAKITPVAKRAFAWFAKKLKVPQNNLVGISDSGGEFHFEKYKTWGIRIKILARGPAIESKNAQFQSVLYRLAKLKTTISLKVLTRKTVEILNNTRSSLHRMTPNESLAAETKKISDTYNSNRHGKHTKMAVRARKLKKNDKVRLINKEFSTKEKMDYKTYKGLHWSTVVYTVLAIRGNSYKIDGPKGKKFYHRDDLRLTSESDKESERIIKERVAIQKRVMDKALAKKAKAMSGKKTALGRPRRQASKKAIKKIQGWLRAED